MISLGVKEFLYLSDTPKIKKDYKNASKLLNKVTSHKELFNLKLPNDLPPLIFYDTVLKLTKNPQPKLNSDIWVETLAQVYQLDRFYKKLFLKRSISDIIVSHPWKNEFGILLSAAFQKK